MKSYSEVLKGLVFSMHSRRFLASLLASGVAWAGWKYGIPYEVQAVIQAPIVAFILGESYRDGKSAESASTVNVGSAENVSGSTPAQEPQPPAESQVRVNFPPIGVTGQRVDTIEGEVMNNDFAG